METRRRLLVIGLDGLEISYAEKLMDTGELPVLNALRKRSASFLLEHGTAQRTGLAWEHFASGLSPEDANRFSAVEFNPQNYKVWQEGTRFTPFFESLQLRTVVFDPPYFDLTNTEKVFGVAGWGAHDPGTYFAAQPDNLKQEMLAKFGHYPSQEWIYGIPCYSVERCQAMGDALVRAIGLRTDVSRWLLKEKFPDWDLFYVVTGEIHSAIEGLWHGVDPQHPLYKHPSAEAAAEAMLKIHRAVDQMVGDLIEMVGDADVIAFAMGGMGANESDLQNMVLLPELLYRHSFKQSLLKVPPAWSEHPQQVPQLRPKDDWHVSGVDWATREIASQNNHSVMDKLRQFKRERMPVKLQQFIDQIRKVDRKKTTAKKSQINQSHQKSNNKSVFTMSLKWHPCTAYQSSWSKMPAFALPSFYDGKIRINLQGRESNGIVTIGDYEKKCLQLEQIIRDCRDVRTGKPVVAKVEKPNLTDPLKLNSSDADMTIVWTGITNGFVHPEYGLIGPIPFRRTGGHTGRYGMALISGANIEVGFQGVRSSFDVAPTIVDLMNVKAKIPLSGKTLWQESLTSAGKT